VGRCCRPQALDLGDLRGAKGYTRPLSAAELEMMNLTAMDRVDM